jgi:hypothetical protein
MNDIKRYGWDSSLNEHFSEYAAQGLQPARICVEHKNIYRLYTAYMDAKQNERVRLEQKKRMKQIVVFQKNFKKSGI